MVRRVRIAWAVWTWVSLAVFVAGLVVVDSARPGLRPWLWAYYGVVQVFLVARTKTLSWRFVALVFGVGVVAAPVIGLIEVAISGQIDADVHAGDGGVYVAGPVEETLKLAPLLVLLLFARRRVQGFAVVDYLLIGYAAGFAFQAVEDAIRQIVAGQRTPVGFGGLDALLLGDQATGEVIYGWGWLQGAAHLDLSPIIPTSEPAFFPGHAVPTALVAVGIGLASRLRWRLGPLVWLLPVALFAMVTVDHALYNEVANRPIIDMPDVEISEDLKERFDIELPSDHEADVPDGLQDAWRRWGRGRFERPLLTLLLVAGMVLDVRRLRRARTTVPPLPAVRSAGRIQRAADAAATSLRLSAAKAGALRRVAVGAFAESLRWLLATIADVWHELALSFLGAAPARPDGWSLDPSTGTWRHPQHGTARLDTTTGTWAVDGVPPTPARRGPSRWLATLYYLRVNRQLGHQAEVRADRRRRRTGWLGVWRALAATSVIIVVGFSTVAQADAPSDGGAFLANLFEELGEWWASLSFGEQVLLIVGGAFLLSWGFGWAFLPTLGYVSLASAVPEHGRGTADFIRDPEEATRRFFRELTPADVLWYAGSEAVGRVVPKGSSLVRDRLRRNVDEIIESADDRVRRGVDDEIDPHLDAPPRPRPAIESDGRWITPGQEPGVGVRHHGNPFNRDYEDWIRTRAGGPHGQEFRYNDVDFDGIDTHRFDGTPGDVLVDAKGDYEQFIDPRTGDWHGWWTRSSRRGIRGEIEQAVRQVEAARGTPVEWRCAQQEAADLFNVAFREDPRLRGKIRAVFIEPPEGMVPG